MSESGWNTVAQCNFSSSTGGVDCRVNNLDAISLTTDKKSRQTRRIASNDDGPDSHRSLVAKCQPFEIRLPCRCPIVPHKPKDTAPIGKQGMEKVVHHRHSSIICDHREAAASSPSKEAETGRASCHWLENIVVRMRMRRCQKSDR